MKNYFKTLIKSVWVVSAASVLLSCESDVWKDHYSYKSDSNDPVTSLAKTIEAIPEAKDFVDILKNTYMYNGDKQLTDTYWDLLDADQFFTVWLPTDIPDQYKVSSANRDHKVIGTEFIMNHIARFSHPVGSKTKEKVKMMSEKSYRSTQDEMNGISYEENNIRCTNGLVHIIDGYLPYSPNLYDYLSGAVSYKSANGQDYQFDDMFGKWFASYTIESIDEERSVPGELDPNGKQQWIDKVIIKSSQLMDKFGYINVEDSNYIVVLPTRSVWDSVYDTLKYYFTYRDGEPARDSLMNFWTISSMLNDAFFNANIQYHPEDSVTSTLFTKAERHNYDYPYHVFYKPYEAGGLFQDRIDSVLCSNGIIYIKDNWAYSDSAFRRPIKLEAEDYVYGGDYKKSTPITVAWEDSLKNRKSARVVRLSKKGYGWTIDYEIPDNLRGKYLLKVVTFANATEDKASTLIHPIVYFNEGVKTDTVPGGQKWVWTKRQGGRWINTGIAAASEVGKNLSDTVVIGPLVFPKSNYKTSMPRATVSIRSDVNSNNDNTYYQEVWVDCVILEPVFD